MKRIGIVHFAPLEKYPPVMNDILEIGCALNSRQCEVFTSDIKNRWFDSDKVRINRIGKSYSQNALKRYVHYLRFNVVVFVSLICFKPSRIICYETLSVFPVFLYAQVRKNVSIHIHYHEYTSKEEIDSFSKYYKYLHLIEKILWRKPSITLSHTNDDRKSLFLDDYPFLFGEKIRVYPNLPPSYWYEQSKELIRKYKNHRDCVKLVHVGALGLDSMYLQEIVEWVKNENGTYELDFYISNSTDLTINYLEAICSKYKFIKILPPVKYYDLPEILTQYDIGLVLYKGHIPNYVYNVPNKVFEYLICGLEVWYSEKLLSTTKFVAKNKITMCKKINFDELKSFSPSLIIKNSNGNIINKLHYISKLNSQ